MNISFQFGAALGLAVVTAVQIGATGLDNSPQAMLDGYRTAMMVPIAASLLGIGITALGFRKRSTE